MSIKRFNPQRDSNEKEIVQALIKLGVSVVRIDWLDLLIGYNGQNYIVEIKTKTGKPSDEQLEKIANWKGRKPSICRSLEEVLEVIGFH
jgi:Holliday junction resolvase